MKKLCPRCKKRLDVSKFNKNKVKKDGLSSCCSECNRKYLKEHYQENKQYYVDKNQKRKDEITAYIRSVKEQVTCKCGESRWYCLEFHHKYGEDKEFTVGMARERGFSMRKIKAEIKKCEILCANCRKELHYLERNNGS